MILVRCTSQHDVWFTEYSFSCAVCSVWFVASFETFWRSHDQPNQDIFACYRYVASRPIETSSAASTQSVKKDAGTPSTEHAEEVCHKRNIY